MTLQLPKVIPPKIEWVWSEKYRLEDLTKEIKVADFERRVNSYHVNKILKSILNNTFYDNVIRCFKENGKLVLLDAQHRVAALIKANREYKLQTYDLMFAIYPTAYARQIYRNINKGKPLTMGDQTKAMDDGTKPFFNQLRFYLAHYRDTSHMMFSDMIYAHIYSLTKSPAIHKEQVDTVVENITLKDVEIMKNFLSAMAKTNPIIYKNIIYKMPVYRNIYRVGFENKFSYEDFVTLIRKVEDYKKLADYQELKSIAAVSELYIIFCNLLVKVRK